MGIRVGEIRWGDLTDYAADKEPPSRRRAGKFPGPSLFLFQQGWTLPLPTTFGLLYLFIFTSLIRC